MLKFCAPASSRTGSQFPLSGVLRRESIRCLVMGIALLASISAAAADPEADAEAGFVSLFDGQTLKGWIGAVEGYCVEDGAITCIPEKGGNLMSARQYADFILKFEFKLTPGANNGIGLRVPLGAHAATQGMEIQILDDTAEQYAKLHDYQYHGSVYGVIPARRGFLKPIGEWNSQEIHCIGKEIAVILNGETIVQGNLDEASQPMTLDGKEHPGLQRTQGHIGFLGHGTRVQFRNVRIREITPAVDVSANDPPTSE